MDRLLLEWKKAAPKESIGRAFWQKKNGEQTSVTMGGDGQGGCKERTGHKELKNNV